MSTQFERNQKNQNLDSFDFLRSIFAIIVVALHANLFNLFLGKPRLSSISDILNLNLGYLAVPVFLQISLFLFYFKNKKSGSQYFIKRRLPKLISLYLFWVTLKLVFDSLLKGKSLQEQLEFQSIWQFIEFIISGGHTIFYFFFSLFFVTFIAEMFRVLMSKLRINSKKILTAYVFLVSSCFLVFLFPIIDIILGNELLTAVINPLNFLPYVFTTAIIIQEFNQGKLNTLNSFLKLKLVGLLALFFVLTILEWLLFKDFPHSRLFPHYSRLSLIVASTLFLYLALLTSQRIPTVVSLLSRCSLGIYGFHIFFIDYIPLIGKFTEASPALVTVFKFFIALTGSIILTLIFKKINKLKSFV